MHVATLHIVHASYKLLEMHLFFVNTPSTFGPVGGYKDFTKNWKRVR